MVNSLHTKRPLASEMKERSGMGCAGRIKQGFTLVELLVVIGIIALLISILLPTLGAARKQASATRCLSNLRQLGNAYFMYANDNKGVWPVAVWRPPNGATNRYNYATDALGNTTSRPWYWHMFLQKYVNSKIARDVSSGTDRDFIAKNNVIWGCPEWRPWVDLAFNGGFNADEVGYGMNWAPTYRPDFPTSSNPDTNGIPGIDAVDLSTSPAWDKRAYHNLVGNNKPGRFFKQVQWTQPSERGLVSDSQYFSPALDSPPLPDGLPQRQPSHVYQNYGSYNLDFFRHGRPGKLINNTFDMRGGKVAINMLYCDGSARTLNNYRDVYLALRRKYPG